MIFFTVVLLQLSSREIIGEPVLVDPVADLPLDLVAHLPEFHQLLLISPRDAGRILKGPVQALMHSRPVARAVFIGIIASSDNKIERVRAQEFIHALGTVPGKVVADFAHHQLGQGMKPPGLQPGAADFILFPSQLAKERLCHLAACGIAGTQE